MSSRASAGVGPKFCSATDCGENVYFGKKFCYGHSRAAQVPVNAKAGLRKKDSGYLYIAYSGCPLIAVHILTAEKAVGRALEFPIEVHHINSQRDDNSNSNLVVCPDRKYHQLLHIRSRALDACGNANWSHWTICKQYDDPANMKLSYQYTPEAYRHLLCAREQYYAKRKVINPRVFGAA